MTKNTAISFMLFSYFGITEEEYDDVEALLNAAISRAYVDMAGHVLKFHFNSESTLSNRQKKTIRHIYRQSGASILKNGIKKEIKEFRSWHYELAKELLGVYSNYLRDEEEKIITRIEFSFGMAQKWINMTIKYIYILDTVISDVKNEKSKLREFREKFDNPDIPVDGYIIQGASKEMHMEVPVREKNENFLWSKWDWTDEYKCQYYEKFQESLKLKCNNQSILDFENELWIAMAKIAKDEEKNQIDKMILEWKKNTIHK